MENENIITITNPIRLIELFGGYGSQALALKNIGADFECYKLVEFDKYAVKSYNAIHNTNFEPCDISNIHARDLGITDVDKFTYIMTYSFPCQDLSIAGKQNGMKKNSGTRSGLLWEVERILNEIIFSGGELPQVLFMENVKQVVSKKNMPDFEEWLHFLEKIGYTNTYEVLNAKDYGIPQNRERLFMFSLLGGKSYLFPKKIELRNTLGDLLEKDIADKYYLNKEIKYLADNKYRDLGAMQGLIHVGNINIGNNESNNRVYAPEGLSPTLNTMQGGHRQPKIIVPINTMEDGTCRTIKSQYYKTSKANFGRTSTFGATGCYDGYEVRKLTPRECGRLMGVADEDITKMLAVNSNTQCYKQFGNSIVVNCMEAMFKNLNIQGIPNWDDSL